MNKNILLLFALFALLLAAAACTQVAAPTTAPAADPNAGAGPTAAPAEPTTAAPVGGDVVLDVIGESKSISFSMETLKALPT